MQRRNKGALRRCFCACGLSLLLCAACSGCALLDTLARWVESGVYQGDSEENLLQDDGTFTLTQSGREIKYRSGFF